MLRPSLTAPPLAPSRMAGFEGKTLAGARWEVLLAQTVVVWVILWAGMCDPQGPLLALRPRQTLVLQMEALLSELPG